MNVVAADFHNTTSISVQNTAAAAHK